ncbi:MAG: peptide chain release factor 1 [Gemmatimonadaceae bacterium]|nr:peptide chain release factor 1 [Gemmatimonadaceae bacterium]
MLDPDTARDSRRLAALGRDHQRLAAIVDRARRLERLDDELAQARELVVVPDPELAAEARAEVTRVEAEQARLEEELKPLLVPPDPLDDRAAIVEIRAGTGGDEAALFAHDLWRMYTRYIERRGGWRIEVLSGSDSTLGGVREVAFKVEGTGAFGAFRREAGVHRVQRVPATEAAGRIHTSAATVAVLPEAEDVDVSIDDKDLRIDVYRASGPGGQGVNTTDSAVRITHLPTGIVVTQQDQRSQIQNKAKAMEVLRSRLLDLRVAEQEAERSRLRRSAVSTGDRSAKIRTYNFPQNRVTDHRINYTSHDLPQVLEGKLDDLFDALRLADLNERLEDA